MKYLVGTIPCGYDLETACVESQRACSEQLALRHAKTMLEVQRAAKAWVRAQDACSGLSPFDRKEGQQEKRELLLVRAENARRRLVCAVHNLQSIEKEVRRPWKEKDTCRP